MASKKTINIEQQQLELNYDEQSKEELIEIGKKAFEEAANETPVPKKTRSSKKKTEEVINLEKNEEIQIISEERENIENSDVKQEDDSNEYIQVNEAGTVNLLNDEIIIPKLKEDEKAEEKEKLVDSSIVRFENVTIEQGLNEEQVKQRNEEGNVNITNEKVGKSIFQIIMSNTFTFFNMLYLVITILLCYAQSYKNLTYLAVVIPNTLIGIIQEIKARKMVRSLKLVSASKANVVRNGERKEINTNEVVIDDVAIFTNGNQIYSDAIVMEGQLEVNESMITGESDAIEKKVGDFLYSGSFVTSGTCYAKIEHVGKNNYIEKLATEAKKQKGRKSELLRTLNWIIRVIGFLIVPLFIIQLVQAYTTKGDLSFNAWFQNSIASVAGSIIGLIPSGLFLLTSVALYTAIWRLGKYNNTLVQESYCIEMLARVDTLCLDKTGTITDGTMRVVDCLEIDNKTDYSVREIIGSMENCFEDKNATSEAIIRFFSTNTVLTPEIILPFSSKRKFSAVTFKNAGTFYLGAPEFILIDNYKKVQSKIERFAAQGCRVLALGHTTTGIRKEGIASNVRPIALIVLQDHIRDDAYETIEFFRNNDVNIKVISGDNPITVSEIARRVGIPNANRYISLEGLSDDEVKEIAFDYTVFGRVTPNQKKALVEALKEGKRTVAMTGDGVNDILAMKESDCSIAMASGCEATRNIANLVLMDSNFASMPAVVAEGRRVINNIQRTSTLFLVKTLFTFFLTIFYLILGSSVEYPFQPSQLFLIEMFIIGLPATIISLQPNKERVQGHFIMNVIKNSLPGALTVLIFHILIWATTIKKSIPSLPSLLEIGADPLIYHTVLLIVTIVICIFVLYKMCKPFNLLKIILFASVCIICGVCILFANKDFLTFGAFSINKLLNIQKLDEVAILYTIICLLLVNVVFNLIERILSKIGKIKL